MRKIHELFAGRADAYGTYDLVPSDGKKVQIKGRPVWEPVNESVWSKHLRGEQPLGVVPLRLDNKVNWFAIDVDNYDDNNLHRNLAKDIKKLGLPLLIFETKSGGAHLYCFLTEPMPAKIARQVAARFVSALNLPDSTEIFPKQDELESGGFGSWINMPYFGGTRRCLDRSGELALSLEEFLITANEVEVHPDVLTKVKKEAPPEPENVPDMHKQAPPCVKTMLANGIPPGERNNSLFHIGSYLLRAFPDDFEGMLHDINSDIDEPLSYREVNTIIGQLHKKGYNYLCKHQPMQSLCDLATCKKMDFGVGDGSEGDDKLPPFRPMHLRIVGNDMYYLTVEGGYTVMLSAEDMLNHKKVVTEIFKKHKIVFECLSNKQWHPILNDLCENAELQPAPMEVGGADKIREAFRDWVSRKIGQNNQDPARGGVHYKDRKLTFKGSELISYVQRIHNDLTDKDVWVVLEEDGARVGTNKRLWSYVVKEEWFEVPDDKEMF